MRGTSLLAVVLVTVAPNIARADDSSRPPTLFDLTHRLPEVVLESSLASVTYNTPALQGTSYVQVERLSFEMPLTSSRWYTGLAYDAAIGHDLDGAPRFIPGNPELWVRGVWTAAYGLSFGGGLGLVIPTKSYSVCDGAASTAFAAIAARGWDRALFDPDNGTLRPFLDVRLVTGPVTVQYRQALEIANNFGESQCASTPLGQPQPGEALRLAAVGTVYLGVRFSKLISVGADLIEYYRLDPGLDDTQRPYFAVGAHVSLDTRYFRPSVGVMTNIGSPLDAISRIGAPIAQAPSSFIGVHFSLDFPIHNEQARQR